ncbi:MAG: hypothetical protein C0497_02845 [Gemmatimonas sp.]|nr:hypothetical protein [Gemmatimonas sp.]
MESVSAGSRVDPDAASFGAERAQVVRLRLPAALPRRTCHCEDGDARRASAAGQIHELLHQRGGLWSATDDIEGPACGRGRSGGERCRREHADGGEEGEE